ncbi:right-handed parallel beta-helix repeat-containing protein [Peribacillus huizhouensis]|uniref:Nitrous oxidase accessory protein n=1 Tax=Peribacillus huizhouensis TaxID=1501239 RepID=A0ABR6CPH0_9BACI|nr:NosD domain-containing protein [Peribacillus huizhouensis]MBA9026563.1 nitrous oxidase accessory protein [Peribacillus huizhouensis]
MKIMNYIMLLLVLSFFLPAVSEAEGTIQSKINEAQKGAVIEIEEGEYEETLVITKPITLKGKGEILLRSCLSEPVVTISGESVTLKNIKVEHCGDEKEATAIYVTGSNHKLEGIAIETKRFGIRLDNANGVTIKDSEIVGRKQGNGIDLWKSNQNKFENLKINNVLDGIYLEKSDGNTIHRNDIQRSRYGLHLMFSNENVLEENASRANITGTMLMESKRTVVRNNKFLSNNKSVNAQGLLIYLSTDTEVTGNEFISNRVGIFIEEAENNRIDTNKIMDNFIGVQFKKSNENKVIRNTFVGNVNDAQAIESANNQVNGNYWDAASKIDVNGDGKSEIVYSADPYFLTLTNAVPEYQLFFQTPGLILLQNILKSPADQLLTDSAPLMNMTLEVEKEKSTSFSLWVISVVMILSSFSLFIFGRKRR